MPRPKRVSDEAVLAAAAQLLFEGGSAQFTLSDVANAVGIARATLIQRFDNRETILRKVAERQVSITAQYLDGLPLKRGRDGLWQFLETIVGDMGDGEDFGVHVELAWLETADPELRSYAADRYALVQAAIAARMPASVAQPAEIAAHLHAVIAGATMQWVAGREGSLSQYVLNRLKVALNQIRGLVI
jgi:TetR/AcrR family macrolide resistance operon transcriptional repressor